MDVLVSEYGGKGAALHRLQQAGFPVPEFIVLPVSFFKKIYPESSTVIEACQKFLPEWQAVLGAGPVAVRSSAVAEDSAAHSFAGQFKTLLNVSTDSIPQAVAEVWQSAGQGQAYANAHGLEAQTTEMAVILQRMVNARAAGVVFSANPLTGTEEIIVNAVAGLGDALVDGSSNADSYAVLGETVIQREPTSETAILTDAEVLAVASQAARAHCHFGGPQDMEFAFEGDMLYILQARPITTLPRTSIVWDNSNIVESYPGLTQPLTFTFIQKMYEAVYRQFSTILGVSQAKMEHHADAFASMLGLLNGRVYYNLNSWYQALALLPGYSLNAAFMEKMMGVKEKPDITLPEDRTPGWKAWWDVATAIAAIVRNLAGARKQAGQFAAAFDKVYARFDAMDFDSAGLQELWQSYQEFETLMVREWKAPLVNDFFAMIYFGLLQKLCTGLAPGEGNLHNRLLAGSEAVLTTQPMKELPRIVAVIRRYTELLRMTTEESDEALYQALQRPEHAEVWTLFSAYIHAWGERSVAELKLETTTYRQDPLLLVGLLRSYLKNGKPELVRPIPQGEPDRIAAGRLAQSALKGHPIKRAFFAHVLRQARYFVTQRENLRYYRTRGFGMVRRLMLAMGQRLAEAGSIETARDVFWLELTEIQALSAKPAHMHEAVHRRKALYQTYEDAPVPERIVSYGIPKGVIRLKPGKNDPLPGNALQGIPCSAGVVRAPVRLVRYSDDLSSLDGAILATYATDPGFVVLFASASGILTERGSLLSHAAIVSREMGIPCIVGIDGLMERLTDGMVLEMDGSTGTVTLHAP